MAESGFRNNGGGTSPFSGKSIRQTSKTRGRQAVLKGFAQVPRSVPAKYGVGPGDRTLEPGSASPVAAPMQQWDIAVLRDIMII